MGWTVISRIQGFNLLSGAVRPHKYCGVIARPCVEWQHHHAMHVVHLALNHQKPLSGSVYFEAPRMSEAASRG